MTTKGIVLVNGQGHTIQKSGGVGKYTYQLFHRFHSADGARRLQGLGVRVMNFPFTPPPIVIPEAEEPAAPLEVVSASRPTLKSRARDWTVNQMRNGLNPVLYRGVRKVYRGARDRWMMRTARPNVLPPPRTELPEGQVIFHETTNYTSCVEMGRWSRLPRVRLAVTFLDIQDYFYPEYFSDAVLWERALHYKFYKERADAFFAISEFTKETMVNRLGVSADRITVTPLAADDMEILQVTESTRKWVEGFGRYLIYPAKPWEHKNHRFLLKAISRRRSEMKRAGMKLLLTGGFNPKDIGILSHLIQELQIPDIVQMLGFQSEEAMQALIANAEFLVFPSLFEGFGIPVLEAMQLRCPVLSSTAGSLPEVGGNAAVYFDPKVLDSLVATLDQVLKGELDRAKLISAGLENARRFGWENTFELTAERYREML